MQVQHPSSYSNMSSMIGCEISSIGGDFVNCNSSHNSPAQHDYSTTPLHIQNNPIYSNSICGGFGMNSGGAGGGGGGGNSSSQRLAFSREGSGFFRHNKLRGTQSLCSCDANSDTTLNPDPTRPLYQYTLERRRKEQHTYTCEQNAQILLRLERKRNCKLLAAAAAVGSGSGAKIDNGGRDIEEYESDTPSFTDINAAAMAVGGGAIPIPTTTKTIPSVPLRDANNHNMHLLHHDCHASNASNASNNDKGISSLCHSEIFNVCTKSATEVSSMIDDCTSVIMKCANSICEEISTSTSPSNNANIPELPHQLGGTFEDLETYGGSNHASGNAFRSYSPHYVHDDIVMLNTKKSDPNLCFLHGNSHRAPLRSRSNHDLRYKYNTIGPSSSYGRELSQYNQQFQQFTSNHNRCRCFSQSFLDSSSEFLRAHHRSNSVGAWRTMHDSHNSGRFPYNNDGGGECGPPPLRSYSNLDNSNSSYALSRLPYHKLQHPAAHVYSSSCSFGVSANLPSNTSFTTISSSNSGLKEKKRNNNMNNNNNNNKHNPLRHHPVPCEQHQHQHQHQHQQQQQHNNNQHQFHSNVMTIIPWKHRQCSNRGSPNSSSNSFRFDVAKHWLAVCSILLIVGAASVAVPLALRVAASAPFEERMRVAIQLLDQVPLIDGHNDLPWNIRKFLHNKLNDFNFDEDLRNVMPWAKSPWSHTDLQRLKNGRISAQFWAAYVPCEAQHRDAVQLTLEQIDVIKRLTDRYSPQLTTCTSSQGVEGGHSLGGSLAVLRTLYAIGVRYMTLTSTCHTPWADSSYADAPTFNVKHGGLTLFGKTVIREMNRLGMMVDLSHVSTGTMRDALEVSEAPVIFSHSSAYELCNSSRNVQDNMLKVLAKNGGLVMVNFYSKFLSCSENSTVMDAVAHINHIKRVAGIDHVGLGAGYDGINFTPKGLEDVSSYPALFAELLGVGWSIEDLTKLAGGNFLRVMQQVELVRDKKKEAGVKPYEDHPNFRIDDPYNCTSS